MSFSIVTAFYDINRSKWNTVFSRPNSEYFQYFEYYFNIPNDLIVFLDKRYEDEYNIILKKYNKNNISCILIDEEWLSNNIWCWKLLEKEEKIMKDPNYISIVKHRYHHPEHSEPLYTMINHAKIDFVNYAINNNLIKNDIIAWSDFGLFRHGIPPKNEFDINKLNPYRINFMHDNEILSIDNDIKYTLIQAQSTFIGGFWIGHKQLLIEYQKLYHEILLEFQSMNIADDDQHIILRIYFKKPELMELHFFTGNPMPFSYFQKD